MKHDDVARRTMLSAFGAAAATVALGSTGVAAQAPARAAQPPRHEQDEWMSRLPGRHRTFIDCATVNGAGEGMLYANNLYVSNRDGYKLPEGDIAVIVGLRHFATVFAYNDAMWAKYGKAMSDLVKFTDPKTKQVPTTNLLNASDYGLTMSNFGNSIASVVKRGTHFSVCNLATHFFADQIAMMTKGNGEAVYKDLAANLIPNSHLMAAGVLAVNRSQELGFTLLTAL